MSRVPSDTGAPGSWPSVRLTVNGKCAIVRGGSHRVDQGFTGSALLRHFADFWAETMLLGEPLDGAGKRVLGMRSGDPVRSVT